MPAWLFWAGWLAAAVALVALIAVADQRGWLHDPPGGVTVCSEGYGYGVSSSGRPGLMVGTVCAFTPFTPTPSRGA